MLKTIAGLPSRCARNLADGWHRFRSDRSGVAATEFAGWLPFILLGYLTTYEASRALEVYRKVGTTSETVGNLVTRSPRLSDAQINNIFGIANAMMAPFSSSRLTTLVTAVRVDATGRATVHWSRASKGAGFAAGAAYALPSDLKDLRDTYVVMATANFSYEVLAGYGGVITDMTMSKTYAFRPRTGQEITWGS